MALRSLRRVKGLIRKYGLALLGATPPAPFERFKPGYLFSQYNHRGLNIDPRLYLDKRKFLLTDAEITDKNILALCQKINSIDDIPTDEIKSSIFYIYFESDSDALPHLKKIIKYGGTYFPPLIFGKTQYRFTNRTAFEVLQKTWQNAGKLSHLHLDVHENICEALEITKDLQGDFVEIGVYMGGSAYTALNYIKAANINRKAWLLDTYDGFNYPEATASADGIWKGTHALYGIQETMRRINEVLSETGRDFHLVASNIIEQNLPKEITKIAVANIDVDIYDATKAAMMKVAPLIVKGGIMICEDATSTPGLYGAAVALQEFLETEEGKKFMPMFKGGQYFLIKIS